MPLFSGLLASALYLLPLAVVAAARREPRRTPPELAAAIPAVVAVDLLGILALARVTELDRAVLLSRAAWGVAAVAVAVRRWRRRSTEPRPRDALLLATLGGAAAIAFALSALLSRPFAIWDRQWHIPLVTSLRGQQIPFQNVYQPSVRLGYHVSGDVLAGALQTLSFARLHASDALSLAHDLLYALTAIAIAAALYRPEGGLRRALLAGLAPLAVLLAGPLTVLGSNMGFSYLNYYQMSFRPHVVLAGLAIVGVTCAVLLDPWPTRDRSARPFVALLASLALLAITDEPAAIMLVPALALVLFLRRRSAAGRWTWLWAAGLLPVTVAVALALFPSALIGGARTSTTVVAPQVPSLSAPPLSLFSLAGFGTLLADTAPMLACLAVMAVVVRRSDRKDLVPPLALGVAALALACTFLTTIVASNSPGESHRFMTLPMVVVPLLALAFLEAAGPRLRWGLLIPLGAGALCSALWAITSLPALGGFVLERYAAGLRDLDCREVTGARLGEPARPTYVPVDSFYVWAGCHPVLASGRSLGGGETGDFPDVGRPIDGLYALRALSLRFVPPGADLAVACPALPPTQDRICRFAAATGACQPAGTSWRSCLLTPAARRALGAQR